MLGGHRSLTVTVSLRTSDISNRPAIFLGTNARERNGRRFFLLPTSAVEDLFKEIHG